MMHSYGESEEPLLPGDICIPYEAHPEKMWSWERMGYFRNALLKFGRMMDADFYPKPPALAEAATYHYLNSASLPSPVACVRDEARRIFELWSRNELDPVRKEAIVAAARTAAAALVQLPDERGVVLCRNASEALSYFLLLSGILEKKNAGWPLVLSTDVENPSIQRQIFIIQDHSNVDRRDPITTFSEFSSRKLPTYPPLQPQATGLRWGHFHVARTTEEQSLEHLEEFIRRESPSVLILSHVLRTTGRALPVAEWIQKARAWKRAYCPHDPDLFVCIDGAQALGNIPVDVTSLDCDMYVGCAHKALQSEAVGLLYIDPSNPRIRAGLDRVRACTPDRNVVVKGMFHDDLCVPPTVEGELPYPELAAFVKNAERLAAAGMIQGNDVSTLARRRSALRAQCAAGLEQIAKETGRDMTLLDWERGTPFILAFRMGPDPFEQRGGMYGPEGMFEPGAMHSDPLPTHSWGKRIAEQLHARNVGIAFLRRGNVFRLSFSDQTTQEDVDAFLQEFRNCVVNAETDE